MNHRALHSGLAAAALLLLARPAQSQSVFYEPFPYEPGLLSGAGPWSGEEARGAVEIMPGNLNYEGLAPSQKNRMRLPKTASKVHEASCHFNAEISSPWFSFLMRVDSVDGLDNPQPFTILRFTTPDGKAGCGLYLMKSPDGTGVNLLASKRANPEKCATSPVTLTLGKPALIVGRYDTSVTPQIFRVWINPGSLGGLAAPDSTFDAPDGNDLSAPFSRIHVGGGVKSPGLMIDEIRIGETWADVTPAY